MNWTGVQYPVTFTGTSPSGYLGIYGSFILNSLVDWSWLQTTSLLSSNSGNTVNTTGIRINELVFAGTGEWYLQDSLRATTLRFANGTCHTNNHWIYSEDLRVDTLQPQVFAGTSRIEMNGPALFHGASAAHLDADSASVIFRTQTFIWTEFHGHGGIYDSVAFIDQTDGKIYDDNSIKNIYFSANSSIIGSNSIDTLTYQNTGYINMLGSAQTQTISGNLIAIGDCDQTIFIMTDMPGIQSTIHKASGIVTLSYVSLQDINVVGGATFIANEVVSAFNLAGWSAVNLVGPRNFYWINGSGNWNQENHWSLSSGGVPAGCVPTNNDNAFFDANSALGSGDSVLITPFSTCNNLDWTGTTGNPKFQCNASYLIVNGNITLVSSMITSGLVIEFQGNTGINTITTAGNRIEYLLFYGNATYDFSDDVNCSQVLVSNGTIRTNNHAVNAGAGGFIVNSGCTAYLGTSVITTEGFTANALSNIDADSATINIVGHVSAFFGGGKSYNVINSSAYSCGYSNHGSAKKLHVTSTIFGITYEDTFDTLSFDSPDSDVYFPSDSLITVNQWLTGGGQPAHLMRLHSNSSGIKSYVTMPAGDTACLDYVIFIDQGATGGGVFYSGTNSMDSTNNAGWNFYACGTPLGIDEGNPIDISVYPNPSNGIVNIISSLPIVAITVTDALGNTVPAILFTFNDHSLDVTALAKGIYLLQITTETGSEIRRKFVIQ
jgi:hypothetical protein